MSESAYNSPLLSRKIAELSECSSAYSSPLLGRRFPESCFSSPARSIASSFGEPHSLTDSEFDGDETLELVTEVPGQPDQTVVDGWVKFRDNKRVSEHFYSRGTFLPYIVLLQLALKYLTWFPKIKSWYRTEQILKEHHFSFF